MPPRTPAPSQAHRGDVDIEVGDLVNVPGDMHGTVKFVGSVRGKAGTFAGVELSREFSQRGKNDGDVDGVQYFTTSIPHSGIFLPIGRAAKRPKPDSSGSFPRTPTDYHSAAASDYPAADADASSPRPGYTPPTPFIPKFSQSVGPGRAASPLFKPRTRPSLPRPESPVRRQPNGGVTPAARTSLGGTTSSRPGGPRFAPSPTPGKFGPTLKPKRHSNTLQGEHGRKTPSASRPGAVSTAGARSESAIGHRSAREAGSNNVSKAVTRSSDGSYGSSSGYGTKPSTVSAYGDDEATVLRNRLEERDRQLKEQAASLAEMERSLAELQSIMASNSSQASKRNTGGSSVIPEDADATQLRAMLREKNEKIRMLTAEFDTHRADFRSTIDTLEMASTETERVYEKRVEDLLQDLRELQDRNEDVEIVARQLKQLEELVQELEEGLEDARRGEAEARAEVEFLRGEVERGRSELKREREKAAAALKGAGATVNGIANAEGAKEVEQRDDEIRGLKAIIHSLSRDPVSDGHDPNGRSLPQRNATGVQDVERQRLSRQLSGEQAVRSRLEHELRDLRSLVERKLHREGELERELERLRLGGSPSSAYRMSTSSEHTVMQGKSGGVGGSSGETDAPEANGNAGGASAAAPSAGWRDSPSSSLTAKMATANARPGAAATQLETMHEHDTYSSDADGSSLWCEICDIGGHDILTCTNMFGTNNAKNNITSSTSQKPVDQLTPSLGTAPNPRSSSTSPIAPNAAGSPRTGRDVVVEGLKGFSMNPAVGKTTTTTNAGTISSIGAFHGPAPSASSFPAVQPRQMVHHAQPQQQSQPQPPSQQHQQQYSDDQSTMAPGKASGIVDPNKWCALCERDGHESVDCPFEEGL